MGGGSLLLIGPPSLLQVLIEALQAVFDGQPEHLVCSPAGRNVLMLDWKRPYKQTGPRLRPLLLY